MGVTATQQRYLFAIRSFIEKHKRSPSYSELAKITGVRSSATIHKAVIVLESKGYIVRKHGPGNGYTLSLVPEKLHGLNSCNHGHNPVWFMSVTCPVCELLNRFGVQNKTPEVVASSAS
jgi:SOS-response transcriptional repressor LexA